MFTFPLPGMFKWADVGRRKHFWRSAKDKMKKELYILASDETQATECSVIVPFSTFQRLSVLQEASFYVVNQC